jgi:subtilisin family serine protease
LRSIRVLFARIKKTIIAGGLAHGDFVRQCKENRMNKPLGFRGSAVAVALALGLPALALGGPRDVDSLVLDQLRAQGRADIFVKMSSDASLDDAESYGSKNARAQHVYDVLNAQADQSQQGLRRYLDQRAVGYQVFWINNSILIRGASRDLVNEIAGRSDVAYIRGNHTVKLDVIESSASAAPDSVNAIEWGVQKIRAPAVWATGNTGQGIVVSSVDTGVRYTHHALVNQYRGNTGAGFDHNYNWWDPSKVCGNPSLAPCDNNMHGTHTMGTMVGDDGGTNQIGVAPGAKWIATKGCETNSCSDTALIGSAQFIACPTRLDGSAPDCTKAPDVVNNSWGGGGGDNWYISYVRAWQAAGIIPVFSAGNSGSNCNTMGSPGDYPNVYGIGAISINDTLASFSSKGPGIFKPQKPDFVAPGDNVRSSTNSSDTSYGNLSGTSMAAPHVVGSVALYLSARPAATFKNIYAVFKASSNHALNAPPGPDTCGGRNFDVYPNFIYGNGRLDIGRALGQ